MDYLKILHENPDLADELDSMFDFFLLDEMYQDEYYPAFLVDKLKGELQKVIDLLESGETDTEVIQETLDEASLHSCGRGSTCRSSGP